MKLNPKNWLIIIAAVAITLLGWNFVSNRSSEKSTTGPTDTTAQRQVEKINASVTINPGSEAQVLSVQNVEIEDGQTALDVTNQVADAEISGEGEMTFVTSINGREADATKNEFWELVINGESAQVGAGSYKVRDGDEIEWRISQF